MAKVTNNQSLSVYAFIDASNIWEAQKVKGKFIDYEKLKKYIKGHFKASIVKVYYYTAYPADGTREYSLDSKHKFFTYLKKRLGFEVRKKPLKRIKTITDKGEFIKKKGIWMLNSLLTQSTQRTTIK